jgi:hypothetical protein
MSYTHTSSVRLEFPLRVELNGINLPDPQKDRGWILRSPPMPIPLDIARYTPDYRRLFACQKLNSARPALASNPYYPQ